MLRWLKRGLLALVLLALLPIVGLIYLSLAFPKVGPASARTVQASPELIARGEYLAEHVAVCVDCHSVRDWKKLSGPVEPGTYGQGGEFFPEELGLPGNLYSKNITPAGIGEWSDGELIRAFTTGITRDGEAMFPLMPYRYYRHMCEQDVDSIVAYIRTLAPIEKDVPASKLNFPMNFIVATIPDETDPWDCPVPGTADYGKYLTTMSACKECHTQQDRGQQLAGMDFAGGWRFPMPHGGTVSSANITPDKETGIGNWTREMFIRRFKAMAEPGNASPVKAGAFNTIMPWSMYGGMTEEDLGAIYDYLQTQSPVTNRVTKFTAN